MRYLFDSEIPDSHKNNAKVEIKFAKKHNKRQLKKGWLLLIVFLLMKKQMVRRNRPEWAWLKMQDLLLGREN
jgi:hypothetical protein